MNASTQSSSAQANVDQTTVDQSISDQSASDRSTSQVLGQSAPTQFTLKRLGHIAICVKDIPKSVQFYQNLGMELAWQDRDWAYLKAGSDGLALLGPDYAQAGSHFGFVFSDRTEMESHHSRLRNDGVRAGEIHGHRDGTASFYAKDPDGNTFEFLYEPN